MKLRRCEGSVPMCIDLRNIDRISLHDHPLSQLIRKGSNA